MGVQEILDERLVQAQRVGQPRGLKGPAVEQLRQLPQRPRPLDRHGDRFPGPPAPRPQLGGQRPVLARREEVQGVGPPDQGLQ
jgi:hypothetical protein